MKLVIDTQLLFDDAAHDAGEWRLAEFHIHPRTVIPLGEGVLVLIIDYAVIVMRTIIVVPDKDLDEALPAFVVKVRVKGEYAGVV